MNEKYLPLYRKYRPQALEEIVGQEHVKKALSNAIELNKITHAYLFTGPRGTGKTSCARILAKSLNCKNGPTLNPCSTCESCEAITNSIPIDVIEIDAASNRKVEDAQNILEKIQYVPVNGKYKIYIIDEVHMLTNHAFNALLKTLEEPPENVVFILATTEPQKVPDTIKSRCQRFDFKRITTEDIAAHLKHLAKLEKIKIEDEALMTIAKNSEGGMRDSIALLDQLSILDLKKAITTEDINTLLGRISFDTLFKLMKEVINSNPQKSIEVLEEIYNSGNEPGLILSNLLNYLKNLLISKTCKEELLPQLTQLNTVQITNLLTQTQQLEAQQIIFLIERTSYYIKEIKTTTTPHLWLEVAMIDLSNLTENTSLLDLERRITDLEKGEPTSFTPSKVQTITSSSKPETEKNEASPQPAKTNNFTEVKENKTTGESMETDEQIEVKKAKADKKDNEYFWIECNGIGYCLTEEDYNNRQKLIEKDTKEEMKIENEIKPNQTEDIKELWLLLLKNINSESPSTAALLNQHGIPVEISAQQITISLKQELFVKKLNTEDKKELIKTAMETLFKNANPLITISLSDLKKNSYKDIKENSGKTKTIAETPKPHIDINKKPLKKTTKEEASEKEPQEIPNSASIQNSASIPKQTEISSDTAKMILQLFDGKYLD